jgi:small-conductance mechanosensitive channel
MPFKIEREGKEITVWTQDEVDQEVKGLKITNENLKAEKSELAEKMREAKELASKHEEDLAKARGDTEKLQQIAEQREAEKRQAVEDERKRFSDLLNMTKQEKITNFIDSILDEVKTADNTRRKQLKKLLKVDFDFDVDIEKGEFSVRGDNVTSKDDLIRTLRESDEYAGFLAGSGSTGGGATGGNVSGAGRKPLNQMTESERLQFKQDDPVAFAAALKR